MTDNRISYLDILKIIALFFVVCIHLVAGLFVEQPVDSDVWFRANAIDSVSRWCVPVFVMVSGALMLRPDKYLSIKRLYLKNIVRLVIAFLAWSLFYALVSVYRDGFQGFQSLFEMIVFGKYHMWFIFMIVGVYIMIPVLRLIAQSRTILIYTIIIWFILLLLSEWALLFPGTRYSALMAKASLDIGYLGYALVGYWLSTCSMSKQKLFVLVCLGALGMLVTFVGTTGLSLADGACDVLYDYCSINVAVSAMAVFALVKRSVGHRTWNASAQRLVSEMGDRSLGVYFVHVFFLELLNINIASFNVLEVALYACGIFALSYIVAFLLRFIPKIGKYIA